MMRRIPARLTGVLVPLCTGAQAFGDFSFPDFSSTAGLVPLDAQSQQVGTAFRLTESGYTTSERGGVQFADAQRVLDGFTTTFRFQITDPLNGGGEGFAFVLHPNNGDIGDDGSALGYGRIHNVLAVEFDTRQQSYDPNDNHISVHLALGPDPDASNDSIYSIATAMPSFDINDGNEHTIRLDYGNQVLRVFADDLVNPLLTVGVDLSAIPLVNGTDAYVAFTSGIDNSSANHDILSWSFQSRPSPNRAVSCCSAPVPLVSWDTLDDARRGCWRTPANRRLQRRVAGARSSGPGVDCRLSRGPKTWPRPPDATREHATRPFPTVGMRRRHGDDARQPGQRPQGRCRVPSSRIRTDIHNCVGSPTVARAGSWPTVIAAVARSRVRSPWAWPCWRPSARPGPTSGPMWSSTAARPAGSRRPLAAASRGTGSVLVEPSGPLGGLTTSGLSHTDFHSFEGLTGAFLEFAGRVEGTTSRPTAPIRRSRRGVLPGHPRRAAASTGWSSSRCSPSGPRSPSATRTLARRVERDGTGAPGRRSSSVRVAGPDRGRS